MSNFSSEIGKIDLINENKRKRHFFTKVEDSILKLSVQQNGPNWKLASDLLGTVTPRQCRDRYQLYLAPHIKKKKWTNEEDSLIIQKYSEIGPKWKEISQHIDGRTDNMIKNRWYEALSKKYTIFNNNKTNSLFGISPEIFEQLAFVQFDDGGQYIQTR